MKGTLLGHLLFIYDRLSVMIYWKLCLEALPCLYLILKYVSLITVLLFIFVVVFYITKTQNYIKCLKL